MASGTRKRKADEAQLGDGKDSTRSVRSKPDAKGDGVVNINNNSNSMEEDDGEEKDESTQPVGRIVWLPGDQLPRKRGALRALIRKEKLRIGDLITCERSYRATESELVTSAAPPKLDGFGDGSGYMCVPRSVTKHIARPLTFWRNVLGRYEGISEFEFDIPTHGAWLAKTYTGGRPLHPACHVTWQRGAVFLRSPPSKDIPGGDTQEVYLNQDTPDCYLSHPTTERIVDPVIAAKRTANATTLKWTSFRNHKVGDVIHLTNAPDPDNLRRGFSSSHATFVEFEWRPTGKTKPRMGWPSTGPTLNIEDETEGVLTLAFPYARPPMQCEFRPTVVTQLGPYGRMPVWFARHEQWKHTFPDGAMVDVWR